MPTFVEIAKGFADRIRKAAQADKQRGVRVWDPESAGKTRLADELRAIVRDLDGYVTDTPRRPLNVQERAQISRHVADELRLHDRGTIEVYLKEASNASFIELASHWEEFFREIDQ